MRVIGTRVSKRWPVIVVGAFLAVVDAVPLEPAEAGAFCGVTGGGGGAAAAFGGAGAAFAGSGAAFGGAYAGGASAFGAAGAADPEVASVSSM